MLLVRFFNLSHIERHCHRFSALVADGPHLTIALPNVDKPLLIERGFKTTRRSEYRRQNPCEFLRGELNCTILGVNSRSYQSIRLSVRIGHDDNHAPRFSVRGTLTCRGPVIFPDFSLAIRVAGHRLNGVIARFVFGLNLVFKVSQTLLKRGVRPKRLNGSEENRMTEVERAVSQFSVTPWELCDWDSFLHRYASRHLCEQSRTCLVRCNTERFGVVLQMSVQV